MKEHFCMDNEALRSLANDRLNQALECINSADADIELGHIKSAGNRAYYAVYHSIRSLINYKSKKHSGNIAEFRKLFIKTGSFNPNLSLTIDSSSLMRNKCDYADYFVVNLSEVEKQLENAKHFYKEVKLYVDDSFRSKPLE